MIRLCDDYSGDVDSFINFHANNTAQQEEENACEDEDDINKKIVISFQVNNISMNSAEKKRFG